MHSLLIEHSQTFVGVLASLFMISVVWSRRSSKDADSPHSSAPNFISEIIQERYTLLREHCEKLQHRILKSKSWGLLTSDNSDKLKYIESHLQKPHEPTEGDMPLGINPSAFEKLESDIDFYQRNYISDYHASLTSYIDKKIKSIIFSPKPMISTVYALLTCIMVFIIDEVMEMWDASIEPLASFLSLFIAASLPFWLAMWGSYIIRHSTRSSEFLNPDKASSHIRAFKRISEHLNRLSLGLDNIYTLQVLLYISIFSFVCIVIGVFVGVLIENRWFQFIMVYAVGMALPCLWVGCLKLYNRSEINDNAYTFSINHFICFSILAFVWTCILGLVVIADPLIAFSKLEGVFFPLNDWSTLLPVTEGFIVFTGIFGPLVLPYAGSYFIQLKMDSYIRNPRIDISKDKEWMELMQQLDRLYNICRRIENQSPEP